LEEELSALNPELGGLYKLGIQLLERADDPGVPHLIGHIGRELTLGVVDALAEEAWTLSERELSEIPENESYRKKIARSLGLSPSDPRVSLWFKLYNVDFLGATHYRRGAPPPNPTGLRLSFERLERLLYGRIGPYFQAESQLDELLAVSEPNAAHIERLQSILLRPQLRKYFFEKLEHSAWLEHLDRIEAFSRPPERRIYEDGSMQAVPWPEGKFLSRMSEVNPEHVVRVLEGLPKTLENPSVWKIVAEVATQVPPELSVRLVDHLIRATDSPLLLFFADLYFRLVERLADAGCPEAFDLADALLSLPSVSEGDSPPSRSPSEWLFPRLRSTQFPKFVDTALASLARNDPEQTLLLLTKKLNQVSAIVGKLRLEYLIAPQIRTRSSDPEESIELLVETTARVIAEYGSQDKDTARRTLELLSSFKGDVFKRLELRLIAAAGHHLQNTLDDLLASNLAIEPGPLTPEIALVLREQYDNASGSAREVFRYSLERGPGPEWVAEVLRYGDTEGAVTHLITEAKAKWQKRRLMWFRDRIPDGLQVLASELGVHGDELSREDQDRAEGIIATPALLWSEPRPFTSQELGERSAEEIAALISTWRPDEGEEKGTIEGFEMSFQELTTVDPDKTLKVREVLGELPIGFSKSLLDGLRDRLIKKEVIAWPEVLSLVRQTVGLATDLEQIPLSFRLDLLRSVIALLDEAVQGDLVPIEFEDDLWDIVVQVTRHLLTSEEVSSEIPGSLDALVTASLNHPTARAVRAALHAGLWSYRFRDSRGGDDAEREIEEHLIPLLDAALTSTGIKRITSEFMIGELLPQMHLIAPAWLEPRLKALLDHGADDPLTRPVWCAYLLHSRFYDSTFKLLRSSYVRSAGVLRAEIPGTSDADRVSWTRKLAEHIMSALLRGVAAVGDEDRLIETIFTNLAVADRQHAYWAVFRAWSDVSTAPPSSFVDRLMAFWEWRLIQLESAERSPDTEKEAEGLGWFLLTPYLPVEEVIRLGVRTARLARGNLESQIDWDRLTHLAEKNPDSIYEIVEIVLVSQLSSPQHFIPVRDVRKALSVIVQTGNPTTRERAQRLMNRLGEAGYEGFRDLVIGEG
jgi:hypothetical protein